MLVLRVRTEIDGWGRRKSRGHVFSIAAAIVALALITTGCEITPIAGSTDQALAPGDQSLNSVPGPAQAGEIQLEAGDKLRVTVFGEDKLSGEYQVNTAGYVSLPLAGSVKVSGMTGPQLERALEEKFKGPYLRNPRVTVEVLTYRPFYVLGEVQKPGEYPYRTGLNVLSAIAIAGGATYRANTSKVLIQRSGSKQLSEFPQSPTVAVMPGDLVRVPERYF
jgi:protein involved in polysaccharide export with SLBB domain